MSRLIVRNARILSPEAGAVSGAPPDAAPRAAGDAAAPPPASGAGGLTGASSPSPGAAGALRGALGDIHIVGGVITELRVHGGEGDTARSPGASGDARAGTGPAIGGADPIGGADAGEAEVIDARGKLALPGLVNAHTHVGMSLLRGYADDLPLRTWLEEKIWPAEDRLTADDVYWGTLLSIAEMIRGGVTAFADMYVFMDSVARAVEQSGVRGVLCRGVMDPTPAAGEQKLDESAAFIRKWDGAADGRITTMLGPHGTYTCTPDYLRRVAALADELDVPIHIHLAETRDEVEDVRARYGRTPVEQAEETGLLAVRRGVLGAHCVHLSERDVQLLRSRAVRVAHNPRSNLKLGSGVAPLTRLLGEGIAVGLGTDSSASNNRLDILDEAQVAALLFKGVEESATAVPAETAFRLATAGGAEALALGDRIGRLQVGMEADIVLMELDRPHWVPTYDYVSGLVYAARASDVSDVFVRGRPVMRDRKIVTFDEAEALEQAAKRAARLFAG